MHLQQKTKYKVYKVLLAPLIKCSSPHPRHSNWNSGIGLQPYSTDLNCHTFWCTTHKNKIIGNLVFAYRLCAVNDTNNSWDEN